MPSDVLGSAEEQRKGTQKSRRSINSLQRHRDTLGAVLKGGDNGFRNANRNKRSQGCSLLHGQDMGKTQTTETVLNNGWRLAAGGGWRLAVGGWGLVGPTPCLLACYPGLS